MNVIAPVTDRHPVFDHPQLASLLAELLPAGKPDAGTLLSLVDGLAREPKLTGLVQHDPVSRWYTRLALTVDLDVWLIGWAAGQATPLHDHGGAIGALRVVDGILREDAPQRLGSRTRMFGRGSGASFGPDYAHRVSQAGPRPAISLHAYSPPSLPMRIIEG